MPGSRGTGRRRAPGGAADAVPGAADPAGGGSAAGPRGDAAAVAGGEGTGRRRATGGPRRARPAAEEAARALADGPAPSPSTTAPPRRPPSDDETVALRLPPPPDDETVALRISDLTALVAETALADEDATRASAAASGAGVDGSTPGGRAARRRAAKSRHGRRTTAPRAGEGTDDAAEDAGSPDGAPLSRVEARRRAKAQKPGAAVIASRAVGEVFITTGVLMLLFVTYQLWWTNVRAHAQAGSETNKLQNDWASGKGAPGAFEPGQGFAILHIPSLDVVVPIAEGTSKSKVLDKGMVGHYGVGDFNTAMPDAKTGNFALAGHRNTHGEPFRYINKLKPGDPVVVETQDKYYVYKVTSTLASTPPSNVNVIDPIPAGSGFTKPGRYITLTTCTPEFTSTNRLIVWGKMVEERSRSKGKPDALVE
ncbi:class E sortase [Streptomyces sp. NPDC008150]|uniref:class E sortase n=1 Tax=Streptomyces sp. NPDC008150 TaxID=3364816 RepID=UPI0036ED64F6